MMVNDGDGNVLEKMVHTASGEHMYNSACKIQCSRLAIARLDAKTRPKRQPQNSTLRQPSSYVALQ